MSHSCEVITGELRTEAYYLEDSDVIVLQRTLDAMRIAAVGRIMHFFSSNTNEKGKAKQSKHTYDSNPPY